MPTTRSEPFILTGYGENTTPGTAAIKTFRGAERLARAGKGMAIAWGAAAASIFIPVAHFLLVPGFALAGVVVFLRRTRTRETTDAIHGTCPDCGHEQGFHSTGVWRLPQHLTCQDCGRLLTAKTTPD